MSDDCDWQRLEVGADAHAAAVGAPLEQAFAEILKAIDEGRMGWRFRIAFFFQYCQGPVRIDPSTAQTVEVKKPARLDLSCFNMFEPRLALFKRACGTWPNHGSWAFWIEVFASDVAALSRTVPRDMSVLLAKPTAPARRGAHPKYDWGALKAETFRLMDWHGEFAPCDPEWDAQARLENKLLKDCGEGGPALSTLRERLIPWLAEWHRRRRLK